MTKPSRPASKGREASSGRSLYPVERALAAANAPRLTRSMAASAPPHSATSASPERIMRRPSPRACTLAAQAVTGAPSGPLSPWRIDTCPAARLTRKDGTVKGDRRDTPRLSVVRTAWAMAPKPPMPEPMMQAVRVRSCSLAGCQPAWARAWSEASSASGMKRSILRWSLGETTASMSQPPSGSWAKSGTWPATWPGTSGARSSGSRLRPDAPDSSRRQANSVPRPSGETMPMPVMTTRRARGPVLMNAP